MCDVEHARDEYARWTVKTSRSPGVRCWCVSMRSQGEQQALHRYTTKCPSTIRLVSRSPRVATVGCLTRPKYSRTRDKSTIGVSATLRDANNGQNARSSLRQALPTQSPTTPRTAAQPFPVSSTTSRLAHGTSPQYLGSASPPESTTETNPRPAETP